MAIIISVRVLELYLVFSFFFFLFHRFRPVKLRTSRLKSASDFNAFVRKLRRRSRPQYARFFTCLCETSVPGHFGLKLFCYPQKLQHDVNQQISRCIVPYIGEGSSCEPVCEEEKILVSLSEAIIPQGTDQKNALQFVRYYNYYRIYFWPIKYKGFNGILLDTVMLVLHRSDLFSPLQNCTLFNFQ